MVQQVSPCCTGTGRWTCTPHAYALPQRLECRRAAERSRTGPLRRSTSEDRTHFGGCIHPRRAYHPHEAIPRLPSDRHAQVLPGDLMSPLAQSVVSRPVEWPSHTHDRVATRNNLDPYSYATTRLSYHRELTLVSSLDFSLLLCPSFFHAETTADRFRRALLFYHSQN
jgi:hypothetical protein